MLKTNPAVFVVHDAYQILVLVDAPCVMWVHVGTQEYYDDAGGVLRSDAAVHRMTVPQDVLDRAGRYTICARRVLARKPYRSELTPETEEFSYEFFPVPVGNARGYHLSDAHNRLEEPIAAARAFGRMDFLILNGDIADHSGAQEMTDFMYHLISEITGGIIPVVFSRGNHDTRGSYAEHLSECTPQQDGRSYYTFRLGDIWGLVLDCGEDKPDDHPEYGGTVCFHSFRLRETEFLRRIAADGAREWAADGVSHRVVIVHHPFTQKREAPFNIEEDLYQTWARILREQIHPDVMICGHMHTLEIRRVGDKRDDFGQPCPVVIGGAPAEKRYGAAGYSFTPEGVDVTFTWNDGEVSDSVRI